MDDKSTDNSVEIIKQYTEHPKVTHVVLNDINSGSTFLQWRKGFNLASGEYIWIAESDDMASPEFLSSIVPEMEKDNKIVLGFSNLKMIDRGGKTLEEKPLITYQRKNTCDGVEFLRHNFIFGCHILNASSAVFRKDALVNVPEEYVGFKGAGDYLFWIEIARQGKVFKCPEILDGFRQHGGKVTPGTVASGLQFKETNKIFHRLCELGIIHGITKNFAIGFWLLKIRFERTNFKSCEIENEVRQLWENETPIPHVCMALYLAKGVQRYIMKKYLGFGI